MTRVTTPLASHGVLRTTDVDDARSSVAASLAPHRLTPLRDAGAFEALHNVAVLDRLSLHYIDYGTEVEVTTERLGFHLVQIPLGGLSTIQAGTSTLAATPRSAAVTASGEVLRMRYSAGNPRLMLCIAPDLLRERLEVAAEVGVVVTIRGGATVDITAGAGRSWRGLVDVVLADLEHEGGLGRSPLAATTLQLAVVDGLIASLAEPWTDPGDHSTPERVIRRAARLIEEHCAEPLGTPDIAEAVGISVRALQAGFKAHLSTTPMAYMRHARLRRVRGSLTDGSAHSVAEAASRWGVTHLGRFSADYRAAFGEFPSETFRRAR
ncbi:transcriptional regulator, AraC family [Xylanimonas cellulosilytica DSM 15894]|uniref:Transcriptional regulator, AraC family n=1 Tax=Xylanimonas cellulosilytica (strain DSM 15894 / JCM 12276 / CECT 5975 / KCTC 9989 / LMG 20990 / NBRC 107835 / XIL07) TaxID=446471 RepID=D1BV80_XYLCX|nr:AraC family transcriptional regulator [Xylanimonas cellulosilytica]ACZ29351.1 transcriptional regulator, AraC family [Xylanimonas cellulosilytica DSM 15894]